jgi:tetratricopeptide (TPR) repeat protein
MSEASNLFSCHRVGCSKVATVCCSSCSGARYCGKECQKRHWGSDHKRVCSTIKQQRVSDWQEHSVLAATYINEVDTTSNLFDAVHVWRKVSSLKGKQLPIEPLLSRLKKVQAALKSLGHVSISLRDVKSISTSESSARLLCIACLEVLDQISRPSRHENLPYIVPFFQQLQESYEFIVTLQRCKFAPLDDPRKDAHEYCFLNSRLLRARGILLFLQGQNDDAVESLTKAAEVCKDAVILKGETWRHQTGTVLDLGMLLKDMGRLPEALCTLEEAYNVHCEWTGPSDHGLQVIAVEIAELLRKTGDLERAEYFSRVTYEMMKEHHNAGAESLGLRSAAGGRCQILSDMFLQNSIMSPPSSNEDNVLVEAEALAREALAGAEAGN